MRGRGAAVRSRWQPMKLRVTLSVALSALVVLTVATVAAASPSVRQSRLVGSARVAHTVRWMRWRSSLPPADGRGIAVGSRAVLGVAAMADLAPLRARLHFPLIRAFPQLRAAEVRATASLIGNAKSDPRVRYLARIGASAGMLSTPNAPLLTTIDANTGRPYEWQFAAANVGAALELSAGSASID